MIKLLVLVGLYYMIRFVIRFVYPTVKAYNKIKKIVRNQNTTHTAEKPRESLYAKKGEYIEYEEIT